MTESPSISRTLLSILVYLNNAVVLMVLTRPLISNSFRPTSNYLLTLQRAHLQMVSSSLFHFSSKYYVLIASYSQSEQLLSQKSMFSYFVDYHKIMPSGRDLIIHLYHHIPEDFFAFSQNPKDFCLLSENIIIIILITITRKSDTHCMLLTETINCYFRFIMPPL